MKRLTASMIAFGALWWAPPVSACVLQVGDEIYEIADWDPACSVDWYTVDEEMGILPEHRTTIIEARADTYYVTDDDTGLVEKGPAAVEAGEAEPEDVPERWTPRPVVFDWPEGVL